MATDIPARKAARMSARILSAGTENPVCPYCRTEDPDWWEGAPETAGPDSLWEDGCRACRRRYLIHMKPGAGLETSAIQ
jgi:hypothetical protein